MHAIRYMYNFQKATAANWDRSVCFIYGKYPLSERLWEVCSKRKGITKTKKTKGITQQIRLK